MQLLKLVFVCFSSDKSRNLFKFVLVLLSASVERVDISRMRDFFRGLLEMSVIAIKATKVVWTQYNSQSLGSCKYFNGSLISTK